MKEQPLAGLRMVVCRPLGQAAELAERLEAAGAKPVSAPVIAVADPPDGGAALRSALASLRAGDWLVVTSPNGAARVGEALAGGVGEALSGGVGEALSGGVGEALPGGVDGTLFDAAGEVASGGVGEARPGGVGGTLFDDSGGPVAGGMDKARSGGVADGVRVAAIGPGTARAAAEAGLRVDLVPERSVAEGLVEAFGAPSADGGSGRVVLARAEVARPALPDGLRAAGWEVDDVAAYRTVTQELTAEQRRQVAAADGVVFTSSSTVDRLVDAVGTDAVPPLVVSIGPATSATAASYDLAVTVEASDHTIEGAVEALIAHASTWPA